MRIRIGYLELLQNAERIGGMDLVQQCAGGGWETYEPRCYVGEQMAGLCGKVVASNRDGGITIDVPDSPEGLLL